MVQPTTVVNELTMTIHQEVRVRAPLDVTFAAVLDELGPEHHVGEDHPLPMKLEARPGGRWYRDLGEDNGHLWGHVQAIKRPNLIEISGPLFMSFAAISNVQYRLSPTDDGTLITFKVTTLGMLTEEARKMEGGWKISNERIRLAAETAARV